ncbi:MgtC/SapB family protein [Haloferula chungangensis]|uniref:MgtC/SapB family protein n=1 Tax=Haloferula chungangensis TaxID=1048331 RepID=A0ABW2L331_9BACT
MEVELTVFVRALIALVLSGALGWEREAAGKSAGVRTHMLVGLASALFVILGELFVQRSMDAGDQMRFDPIRIVEAVVTGVSFLGAGTIFVSRGKDRVRGLTTAASILLTAAVGMMVGLAFHLMAAGITVMVLVVLHGMDFLKPNKTRKSHDSEGGKTGSNR